MSACVCMLSLITSAPRACAFLRAASTTAPRATSSSSSSCGRYTIKCLSEAATANSSINRISRQHGKWHSSICSASPSSRYFSLSSLQASKAKPRRTSHGGPDESDRLETDADFHRILEEQKGRVADYRAQEKVKSDRTTEGTSPDTSIDAGAVTASGGEEGTQNAATKRRELIAKMIEKHVPLKDTAKAIDMFNTLIFGLLKKNAVEEVHELFEQMKAHDIPANRMTCDLLAKSYSQSNPPQLERLQQLMDFMVGTNVGLDVLVFNALITSYAKSGATCKPVQMFTLMRNHQVKEDISTCNLLLANYTRVKDHTSIELIDELYTWMRQQGIKPDDDSFNSFIACCQDDTAKALAFYEDSLQAAQSNFISAAPNATRLSNMLLVFAKAKKLDDALVFLNSFLSRYPTYQLTSGNHGALFRLNVACLKIQEAFNDLDQYIAANHPYLPVDLCSAVVDALKTLPEATLVEHNAVLTTWKEKLLDYQTKALNANDLAEWGLVLLRWRSVYVPKTE